MIRKLTEKEQESVMIIEFNAFLWSHALVNVIHFAAVYALRLTYKFKTRSVDKTMMRRRRRGERGRRR